MMMPSLLGNLRASCIAFVALWLGRSSVHAAPESGVNITAADVAALNSTVNGRLFQGTPVSLPCFSSFNGQPHAVDNGSCTAVQAGYTTPEFRAPMFGAYMQPQWETCQNTHQQCLLDDLNLQDPQAFTNTTCFQGSVAPFFIDVREASDVQAAFAFANKTGVKLSIKNSGHDYKGRSSGQNTLGLWVHNLNSTSFDPAFVPQGCSNDTTVMAITTGTGSPWEQVYDFADANNVTIIGGYHQTIAAAGGWLMGGGHSVLSPVFGLGVDRVLEIQIVTPDGQLRTVNSCQNSDLFWALRGGGGSTFGVVLSATYKVEPQLTLQVASLAFTPTTDNLPDFYSTVLNNSFQWGQEGWGGHVAGPTLVYVNPLLNLTEAQASMKPISDWILSQNGTVSIQTVPSWNAFFKSFVLTDEVGVGVPLALTTRLLPKSLFQTDEGRSQLLNLLLAASKTNLAYVPVVAPVLFNATANSTSVTPAWRDALWHMGLDVTWNFNTSQAAIEDNYALIHNFTETLRAVAPDSGAYFNEGDVYEPDHETSYWGPNYPQLLEIKKKYDPDQLLSCWQCVGWEGPSDERFSCYLPEPST